MKAVTPMLSYVPNPILTTDEDRVAHLLQFMIFNPGFTSSFFEPLLLSYRKVSGDHASDITALCSELTFKLNITIKRLIPGREIRAEVTHEASGDVADPMTLRKLLIRIVDENGIALIPYTNLFVDTDGNINLKLIKGDGHDG